jgi:hypothetical protein
MKSLGSGEQAAVRLQITLFQKVQRGKTLHRPCDLITIVSSIDKDALLIEVNK